MPNSPTTVGSSLSETTGTPIALAYGYNWVTGKRDAYFQLQDTGSSWMDFTRVGRWLLGEGEWDGCEELWINDHLTWRGFNGGPAVPGFSGQQWQVGLDNKWNFVFNYHSGCDSDIGSGFTPSSNGPDQGVDVLCAQFPSAVQPLHYTRIAYYMLMRKQPIEDQTNDHRDDPSQWTDINPVGLWRALKVRLFDANGQMTGYAFSTNPVWHIVDVLLRRVLMPDYTLSAISGPDDLTDAVRARFNWSAISDSALYCDEIISNGRRRFEGHYAFSSQTSLQAILEKMLLCCRGFLGEYAGQISINVDKPRSSVFTFSRDNVIPSSFEADDQKLHASANNIIPAFRDLLVPAIIPTVVSIAIVGGRPRVTMSGPHPFTAKDWIAIGGTDTVYDGEWQVYSVPAITGIGTPAETDPTTFDLVSKGANYPASVGAGGLVGLLYARFKNRTPEFWHKANQYARGVVGNGIARQRNKVREQLDFANCTYDQVARIASYERDRQLGLDTTGTDGRIDAAYITPPFAKVCVPFFAKDKFGNLAAAVQPGDRVTIDSSLSTQYAGEYEVLDGLTKVPPATAIEGRDGSQFREPGTESGEIEYPLGPYNEAVMYDASDPDGAGWLNVPGSDPGNGSSFTQIDLVTGYFVFFTGIQASGSQFQLPSSGFPAGNLIAWASAAGANVAYHSMRVIEICDADAGRNLTLTYTDDIGNFWHGDVSFAALSWLSPDVPTSSGGMEWLELTLLGGETILFGRGVLADGATVPLPAGYSRGQSFATCFVHDTPTTATNNPRIVGAKVDPATGVVSCTYDDGAGNTWHGNAAVIVFAWKNNGGTVTTETVGNTNWMKVTLSNGKKFGVGCALNVPDGTAIGIPAAAGSAASLQAIVGTSTFAVPAGAGHTWGVDSAYLDSTNHVHVTFGEGNTDNPTVSGVGDVFLLYCEAGSAAPTLVTVSPASATLNQGMQQQFAATVQNNANQSVNWSVDGIAGGNVTVGTIDATGLYTSPNAAGSHTITATSVADPTASGSAEVNVTSTGDGSGGGGWLINGT
jgi:hypothetical protein